jgi:hypothetical protein
VNGHARVRCRGVAVAALSMLGPLPFLTATAASSTSTGLARCAAIAAADARLVCYDALAGRPSTADGASAAGATPPTAAAGANDPHSFGLSQIPVPEAPQAPAAIHAHVAEVIDTGVARASVVLDNGQAWTFTEPADDAGLRPGDAVTVKRAALGSFMLVTPSKHGYHVHRTR